MARSSITTNRKSTVASTSVFSFACVIGGAILAFGTTLLVSNIAGATVSGLFFQVVALFAVMTVACVFGSDTALVRSVSAALALEEHPSLWKLLRWSTIPVAALSSMVGITMWCLAPTIGLITDTPQLAGAIRIAAVTVPVAALMTVAFGFIRGTHRIISFALLQNVILSLLRLLAVAVALWAGAAVATLSTAWATPVAIVAILAWVLVWRTLKSIPRSAPPQAQGIGAEAVTFRRFWAFASARGFASLVEILLEWIDVIAVAIFLGPTAAGVYGVVNRCVHLGSMLEHTARIVTGPMLSASLTTGDAATTRRIFTTTARILLVTAWPFYLTLIVFAPVVLSWFGEEFVAGALPLSIIATVMMFAVSTGGVQSLLLMGGKSHWQLINKCSALVVAVTFNLWLVPMWGLIGAVTAWSAAVVVDYGLATLEVARGLRIHVAWASMLWPALISTVLFGGFALFVRMQLGATLPALALSVGVASMLAAGVGWRMRRYLVQA
jgi:O-antigen/teichoic acid export membrane protein